MAIIARPTITRSPLSEPDCYDHFSQSLNNTDLCRPSLADQFRKNAEKDPYIMKRWWEAKAESVASALCVSSDDPRLKGE